MILKLWSRSFAFNYVLLSRDLLKSDHSIYTVFDSFIISRIIFLFIFCQSDTKNMVWFWSNLFRSGRFSYQVLEESMFSVQERIFPVFLKWFELILSLTPQAIFSEYFQINYFGNTGNKKNQYSTFCLIHPSSFQKKTFSLLHASSAKGHMTLKFNTSWEISLLHSSSTDLFYSRQLAQL